MTKLKTPEPAGFCEFWEEVWRPHMRHTDGRGSAREAYRKHILMGATPEDLIDGARGFFRFMPDKDKPYVPLVQSWLNKEAYLDWAEKERAYQARMAEMEQRKDNVVQISAQSAGQTKFLKEFEARKRSNA